MDLVLAGTTPAVQMKIAKHINAEPEPVMTSPASLKCLHAPIAQLAGVQMETVYLS